MFVPRGDMPTSPLNTEWYESRPRLAGREMRYYAEPTVLDFAGVCVLFDIASNLDKYRKQSSPRLENVALMRQHRREDVCPLISRLICQERGRDEKFDSLWEHGSWNH